MALPTPKRPTRGLLKPSTSEESSPEVKSVAPVKKPAAGKKPTKSQEHQTKWAAGNLRGSVSALLRSAYEAAAKETGDDSTCVAGKVGRLVIGIDLPSLCVEWLVGNDVLRLGIVIQLVGMAGSCKSAFAFDMARWFANSGGAGSLVENEDKYSPTWAMSIIGDFGDDVLGYEEASSVEDWQGRLLNRMTYIKKAMTGTKEDPGSGRVFPYLFILDSLMGKPSEETMQSIHEAGFASRAHPVEALKITPYLKTLATEMKRWPFVFVFTNHLKMSKDKQGRNERRKGGGALKEFQESLEFEFTKIKSEKTTKSKSLTIKIECRKNSVGDTGNDLEVRIRWTKNHDPETGKIVQKTKWLWHEATIDLLLSFPPGGDTGKLIKEVVDINKGSGDMYWSKVLGVSKNAMIPADEMGELLHDRKDLLDRLRPLLGIEKRKHFEPGVDYRKQREELLTKIKKEMDKQ